MSVLAKLVAPGGGPSRVLTTVLAAMTLKTDPTSLLKSTTAACRIGGRRELSILLRSALRIRSRSTSFALGSLREQTGCGEILRLTPRNSGPNTFACFPPACTGGWTRAAANACWLGRNQPRAETRCGTSRDVATGWTAHSRPKSRTCPRSLWALGTFRHHRILEEVHCPVD
jgi:hypothetical protein